MLIRRRKELPLVPTDLTTAVDSHNFCRVVIMQRDTPPPAHKTGKNREALSLAALIG